MEQPRKGGEMRTEEEIMKDMERVGIKPLSMSNTDRIRARIAGWAAYNHMSLATARLNAPQIAKDLRREGFNITERDVRKHIHAMMFYK